MEAASVRKTLQRRRMRRRGGVGKGSGFGTGEVWARAISSGFKEGASECAALGLRSHDKMVDA